METAQLEAMGEEMMEEMMKKFEQMGEKVCTRVASLEVVDSTAHLHVLSVCETQSDFQDLVDGMMQQLLSKDVMYDPMRQICERVRRDLQSGGVHDCMSSVTDL